MRAIPSINAARDVDSIRAIVLAPGAEPVAVTLGSIAQVIVTSFKDDQDLLRKTRFAGKLVDLPEEDLAFLATFDERNR